MDSDAVMAFLLVLMVNVLSVFTSSAAAADSNSTVNTVNSGMRERSKEPKVAYYFGGGVAAVVLILLIVLGACKLKKAYPGARRDYTLRKPDISDFTGRPTDMPQQYGRDGFS